MCKLIFFLLLLLALLAPPTYATEWNWNTAQDVRGCGGDGGEGGD